MATTTTPGPTQGRPLVSASPPHPEMQVLSATANVYETIFPVSPRVMAFTRSPPFSFADLALRTAPLRTAPLVLRGTPTSLASLRPSLLPHLPPPYYRLHCTPPTAPRNTDTTCDTSHRVGGHRIWSRPRWRRRASRSPEKVTSTPRPSTKRCSSTPTTARSPTAR